MTIVIGPLEIDVLGKTTGLVCITLTTRTRWTYLHLGIVRPSDWFVGRMWAPELGEYEWGLGPVFIFCGHDRPDSAEGVSHG